MSAQDDLAALEALVASDGWALLTTRLEERIDSLTRDVMGGVEHDAYLQRTAECATAKGIAQWPAHRIAEITAQINQESPE